MADPNIHVGEQVDGNKSKRYVSNPSIPRQDILYHLNLGVSSHDLPAMFSDVKFVCMGGKPGRMLKAAEYIAQELSTPDPNGNQMKNLTESYDRYAIYKAGPVLCISHGVGAPSISIVLHEVFKLLHHANAKGVEFFRLGTCGGIGVDPGTVVVTTEPLNGELKPYYEQWILGEKTTSPSELDNQLVEDLKNCQNADDDFKIINGKTLCADDFYEGELFMPSRGEIQ